MAIVLMGYTRQENAEVYAEILREHSKLGKCDFQVEADCDNITQIWEIIARKPENEGDFSAEECATMHDVVTNSAIAIALWSESVQLLVQKAIAGK